MTDGRRDDDSGATPNRPSLRYTQRAGAASDDARLHAPTYERNGPPLIAALSPWLGGRQGRVLEIGSGSGQHGAAFSLAFPGLDWIASDPAPAHRASAEAWRSHLRLPPRAALDLDATSAWADRAGAPLTAVYSANVIHIAPPAVLQGIIREAPKALGPSGLLIFYGPFTESGRHTGEGNEAFDRRLKAENPAFGLRDLDDLRHLAAAANLTFAALQTMPANNRLVIFRKD